jgi:peptidoglycan L-alanyl-D-glutamate endopeptidase CwlK
MKDYEVTAAVGTYAVMLRNTVCKWDNLGKEYPFVINEEKFVGRVERHYHPPGGSLRPWGPHPGISIFRVAEGFSPQLELQSYEFGARSLRNLVGVHPDLVRVAHYSIEHSPIDFTVIEGLRTYERQRELVNKGASQTLQSRHLTGHAIDLAPWIGGTIDWNWEHFSILGPAVLAAAEAVAVPLEWGGNWTGFRDGPHFQLPWKDYPV